ncbi:hypothetical protein CDAR_226011 [Caerostris darwini]|uniref:Uncharacterized protein n=1 Tax=Caerostris darwini TaxID=1538125 RepID=A0AAV4VLS2_9ARAC|nr:hypothetical protein CDAR_226011 [Caerostris darwini]
MPELSPSFRESGIDLTDICQLNRKRVRSTFPETAREQELNGSVPGIGPEIRFRNRLLPIRFPVEESELFASVAMLRLNRLRCLHI